eukprot:Sspe_Gene.37359::Locus_18028_Transcript_1_1_Confidence_1.000_Length_1436::g.37359::m.37359
MPAKKKMKLSGARWEWYDDDGDWVPYNKKDNMLLEDIYSEKTETMITTDLTFNKGYNTRYKFDFKKMQQVNMESNMVRKIRRVVPGDDDGEDEDEAGYAKVLEASKAAKTKSSPTKAQKIKKPAPPPLTPAEIKEQYALGAPSCRGMAKCGYGAAVTANKHASKCFDEMLGRERKLAGEWAVCYHSYSFAALLYEVQAAVASVLFRFGSQFSSLPRLLKEPFNDIPDAEELRAIFPKLGTDHSPVFRAVAICASTTLIGPDPEAPPTTVFLTGYSCTDLSFTKTLEKLLESCGVKSKDVSELSKEIIKLSQKYGLDVSAFGGKKCESGKPGHLLQIFVRRDLVDRYMYSAYPFGKPDHTRHPISKHFAGKGPISGQVRICCNPSVFMRASAVRMYLSSADPTFHKNRPKFQEELTGLLKPIIGTTKVRTEAARGIYGGELPDWFDPDDCEKH